MENNQHEYKKYRINLFDFHHWSGWPGAVESVDSVLRPAASWSCAVTGEKFCWCWLLKPASSPLQIVSYWGTCPVKMYIR